MLPTAILILVALDSKLLWLASARMHLQGPHFLNQPGLLSRFRFAQQEKLAVNTGQISCPSKPCNMRANTRAGRPCVPPSGRHVWWTGVPIFTFEGTKVRDLFVLGDIHGLIGRLNGEA